MESNKFSSEHIQNEGLSITSKHPSSKNHFKGKFQAKIYPSDKNFEKTRRRIDRVQGRKP